MCHRRLTLLTLAAVLTGTAVFCVCALTGCQGVKKAAQAELVTAERSSVRCTGVVCYDTLQFLTAADFCDYDSADAGGVTTGAVISYTRLADLTVTGLREGPSYGVWNYQLLEQALALIAKFTTASQGGYEDTLFRLTLPPGVYEIDGGGQPLHISQNTWLAMEGVTLRKCDTQCAALLRNSPPAGQAAGYAGNSNLVLTGGVWEVPLDHFDPRSNSDRFSVLRFGHCRNLLMVDVTARGCVNGHHLELCGVQGCSVVNCTFQGYLDTAYNGRNDRKEAIQIDVVNNRYVAPGFSSYDDAISSDILVYGSQFQNLSRGVGGHNAVYGQCYSNIVIQNNRFSNLTGEGIYALNCARIRVLDNVMEEVEGGITLLALTQRPDSHYMAPAKGALPALGEIRIQSSDLVITGNVIDLGRRSKPACGISILGGCYQDPAFQPQYQGGVFWAQAVTLSGNRVTGGGIALNQVWDCAVTDNRAAFLQLERLRGAIATDRTAGQVVVRTQKRP